jgi:signal transduction histidine kinase
LFTVTRLLTHRNEYRVLAAMLFFLHLSMWWDFAQPLSRSLMLAHLGLFLIWQPFWSRSQRLDFKSAVAFILMTIGFVLWLNSWLLFFWLLLLIGLVSGLSLFNNRERYVYMLILVFLVSDLLIRSVPLLFTVKTLPPGAVDLFKYGLLLPLVPLWFIPTARGHGKSLSVDFFRGMTVSLMTAMLAAGSLINMYHTGVEYPVALFQSLLALAAFLFLLSWLLSPHAGSVGLAQLWERSLLNIGTPFEQWLAELARLAAQQQTPEQFLKASVEKLVGLPWLEGMAWRTKEDRGEMGSRTAHKVALGSDELHVVMFSRLPVGPTLFLHCNLLVQLLAHFYTAKQREQELTQKAHLQAVYETGARVTHDIKNLLQFLQTLTLALDPKRLEAVSENERERWRTKGLQLFQRQLPQVTQRLQRALEKLQAPEQTLMPEVDIRTWWEAQQARHAQNGVEFQAEIGEERIVPADLFDSVVDNLLENAYRKCLVETNVRVTVSLTVGEGRLSLRVCDSGSAIDAKQARHLFKQPIRSNAGLGIGLYQTGKQAALMGYRLSLVRNEPGEVCFELTDEHAEEARETQYSLLD